MKKNLYLKRIFTLVLGLFLVFAFTSKVNAANLTENVTIVGDTIEEEIWDGVNLERMNVESKLLGSPSAKEYVYSWDAVSITAENNPAIRIVTWGMTTEDGYKAGTTLDIAKNYEAKNPGYTVVAAINGDFFANTGFTTSAGVSHTRGTFEPINTWVADGGEVIKPVTIAHPHHNVVGLFEDRSYIYHLGAWYNSNLEAQYFDDAYAASGVERGINLPTFTENAVFSINGKETLAWAYKQKASLNEDAINIFWEGPYLDVDVSGYTVWKAKTDRLSIPTDGFQGKYFVEQAAGVPYNLEYTKYYLNGRLVEVEDINTISEVEDGWCYIVTKNQEIISEFARAVEFTAQYELTGDWENVNSAIGTVLPIIVEGERTGYVGVNDQYLNTFKPKTVLAFKEDGTCLFFFMGPGPLSGSKEGGPSSIELAELLERQDVVNAFCLDGGGSSSIIYRAQDGELVELNTPTDGNTRAIGNAVLMVIEDSNLEMLEAATTSATFGQSAPMVESEIVSATLHINGETYDYNGDEIVVDGLQKDTEYSYYFEYTYNNNGKVLSSKTNQKTFKTLSEPIEPTPTPTPSDFKVILEGLEDGTYQAETTYTANGTTDVNVLVVIDGVEYEITEDTILESKEITSLVVRYTVDGEELSISVSEFELEVNEYQSNPSGGNNSGGSTGGGFSCNMGFVSLLPLVGAAALLLIKKRK